MVLNVHRNSKTYWGRGKGGKKVGGEGDYIYLSLHCHNQNDSFIKMGSSLTVRDKVTRQCPQITIFEEKGEPKRGPSAYQPNALPLVQTGG